MHPDLHDVDRARPKSATELGLPEGELEKLQRQGRDQGALTRNDVQAEMDFRGSATAGNKLMDSRHRRADFQPAEHKTHNKHLDTTTRHQPKQHH